MKIINLSSLDGNNGFRLDGVTEGDQSGFSVSSAGDINGDGFDDVIVGAPRANPSEEYGFSLGYSYVVFGKPFGFSDIVDLSSLDGSNGFRLDGGTDNVAEHSGRSVSGAGDINGDGFDDVIVGAPRAARYYQGNIDGASYVVFGKVAGFSAALDLSSLDGNSGFQMKGGADSQLGVSVSILGDINGDGLDDLIVGAPGLEYPRGGNSYVVFGRTSGFDATLDFSSLNGSNGFRLNGGIIDSYGEEGLGEFVSGAGDINGDGFDDVIVSANGPIDYVVFGKASGFSASLDVASLDGNTGFRLEGSSGSVSAAGDINGDGLGDFVIGSSVVLGRASGFGTTLDVASLDGNTGFRLEGSNGPAILAGDVNGDGLDDLIIGGTDANGDGSGTSYVMFGKNSGFSASLDLSSLSDNTGFRLDGTVAGDGSGSSVSSAGDVNGDGFDDLAVGAPGADPNGNSNAGSSYVIFGGDFTNAVTFLGTSEADNLIDGTSETERFVAGNGHDKMSGGGGADVFHGGEGNDIVEISDLDFQLVDGGAGNDTLVLSGSNLNLNLASMRTKISGVEDIDLTGSGNNTLTITALDLLSLSDTSNTLKVEGDSGDNIVGLSLGWIDGGISEGYHTYTQGEAVLQVDATISTDFPLLPGIADLSNLNGSNGFRLDGVTASDYSGHSVSSAGDVNGDGFDDLIIGAPKTDSGGSDSGASYVLFGKSSGFSAAFELSSLDGNNGFRLDGTQADDQSGFSVGNAGDVNGDGFADLIVGANGVGASVVFGKAADFSAALDLSSLDGSNGFQLNGEADEQPGKSVSGAGDINGDGYADLIVGTNGVGASVVFGKASGFSAALDLSDLDGNNGFHLSGGKADDDTEKSVSSLGDINGDGFADLIIGVSGSDASYVVFGKASGFSATLDFSSLDGSNGFQLSGTQSGDQSGWAVSNAGDVNGDSFDDLIIGSRLADADNVNAGASYVVFGKASGFNATFDLSSLDGNTGFRLNGVTADDQAGWSVNSAGDFNGDGFDDLMIGARFAGSGDDNRGSSYLVYGKASGFSADFDLSSLDSSNGFRLDGIAAGDGLGTSVSSAGDLNGDGFADLIVSASNADPDGRSSSGSSYVLFGANYTGAVTHLGTLGADNFTGNSAAESFVTGNGNDIMRGGGGADVFHGGEGNDNIGISDFDFLQVDGGAGSDTLALVGSDINLNLAHVRNKISSIEGIDLAGKGNNTLTLAPMDLLNLSDNSNTLKIDGNVGDHIFGLSHGWTDGGISGDYHIYTQDAAVLQINTSVSTDFPVPGIINLFSLDGNNGFRLDGSVEGERSGISVSSAGDFNDDGYDDLIIGTGVESSGSYVVFGKASGFGATLNLSSLDGNTGFHIEGVGRSVSNAADVNGDGFDDLIVGDYYSSSHVVFGKASGFDAALNLSSLDGSTGFHIEGAGRSVSNAADVNGDGFDDVIVSSPGYSSYVVFGKASGFGATLALSSLDGSNGFRLDGNTYSGSGAGDINGDGFDDVIIGSRDTSYVVFGKATGFNATVALSSLDGNTGFRLDTAGRLVSDAGDVNGDLFDDLIVSDFGKPSYVVFGKASGFGATLALSSLDGSNGFRLEGYTESVSSAGDVNGDGFDDLIIGKGHADPNGERLAGTSYVVFGKASDYSAALDLSSLDGNNGFRMDGVKAYDFSGESVSSAGDVNGDGFDDLIVGADGADPNGERSGSSYIIFGRTDFGSALPEILGTSGDDILKGTTAAEYFKAGDGNDKLIGRGGADIFEGGAGNDKIQVADLSFGSVDGGAGIDVLHLAGTGLNLNLADSGDRISDIEIISLYSQGDRNTLTLTAADLLNLSTTTNTLKVNGNAGGHIIMEDGGWIDCGNRGGNGYYHVYTQDDAVLLVGQNLTVDFV
ncbi:MAG: hypothetical protein ABL861_06810 [Nitrosomonas sp.]